jgi:hypothetical protein
MDLAPGHRLCSAVVGGAVAVVGVSYRAAE